MNRDVKRERDRAGEGEGEGERGRGRERERESERDGGRENIELINEFFTYSLIHRVTRVRIM